MCSQFVSFMSPFPPHSAQIDNDSFGFYRTRTFLSSPFISIALHHLLLRTMYMKCVFKWQQHAVCTTKKIIDNPIDENLRNWFSFTLSLSHTTSMKVKRMCLFYWFHYIVSRYWEIDADIYHWLNWILMSDCVCSLALFNHFILLLSVLVPLIR